MPTIVQEDSAVQCAIFAPLSSDLVQLLGSGQLPEKETVNYLHIRP
jgi:hypothetical protein